MEIVLLAIDLTSHCGVGNAIPLSTFLIVIWLITDKSCWLRTHLICWPAFEKWINMWSQTLYYSALYIISVSLSLYPLFNVSTVFIFPSTVYLSIYLSIYLSTYWYIYVFISLFAHLSILHLYLDISFYLSIHLSIYHRSVCLSVAIITWLNYHAPDFFNWTHICCH